MENEYLSTGFSSLDNSLKGGYKRGELTLLASRPGMGKTAFILSSLFNQKRAICFSLQFYRDYLMMRIGMTLGTDIDEMNTDVQKLLDNKIYYETSSTKLADLNKKIRALFENSMIDIVYIDYLQLVEPDNVSLENHQVQKYIVNYLRNLAIELHIPIVAASQLDRNLWSDALSIDDLRDVDTKDIDTILFLHRPEYYHLHDDKKANANINVVKLHGKDLTEIIKIPLYFNHEHARFTNI